MSDLHNTMDADGNYPDEIEFDPALRKRIQMLRHEYAEALGEIVKHTCSANIAGLIAWQITPDIHAIECAEVHALNAAQDAYVKALMNMLKVKYGFAHATSPTN